MNDEQGIYSKVPLYLENGEEVGVVVKVPPFSERPVIFWGQRIFVWNARFHQYREVMPWVALEYERT